MNETDLLHAFIARAPCALPVRIFRRNIIKRIVKEGDRTYALRNGIAGQGDAYALVRGGMHVEIETKAASGPMRKAQAAWREWCGTWGVPHVVLRARKDEPPAVTVDRWVEELREVIQWMMASTTTTSTPPTNPSPASRSSPKRPRARPTARTPTRS